MGCFYAPLRGFGDPCCPWPVVSKTYSSDVELGPGSEQKGRHHRPKRASTCSSSCLLYTSPSPRD
eukprot:1955699-Alexandrium_andersonii.AAC.1